MSDRPKWDHVNRPFKTSEVRKFVVIFLSFQMLCCFFLLFGPKVAVYHLINALKFENSSWLIYSRVSHLRNHFFGFSLLFSQKLSVSVSYTVVSYMRDSTVQN